MEQSCGQGPTISDEHAPYIAFIHGTRRPPHPLGRFIEHDPRSRRFAVASRTKNLAPVAHRRLGPILDQGVLGSCTGHTGAGVLATAPFARDAAQAAQFTDSFAVKLYAEATDRDDIPGRYPPMDTGSSGLAVAKVLHGRGLIAGYRHAFSVEAALTALQQVPVMIGTIWTSSMDEPDEEGFVRPSGEIYGGHEYLLREHAPDGADFDNGILTFDNHWGSGWGDNGRFRMRVRHLRYLLKRQGDATALTPLPSGGAM